MNYICAALIVIVALTASETKISGFEKKLLHINSARLWKMPLFVTDMKNNFATDFVFVEHDTEFNVFVYSQQNDSRFLLLFDTKGNIAGVRVGYIKSDVDLEAKKRNKNFLYDYDKISMFSSGKYWNTPVWYTSILFQHPDVLKAGGRRSINGVLIEGLYVKLDGEWLRVADDECGAEQQGFTRQGCSNGIGQYYVYKMNPSSLCKDLQPFFAIYNKGILVSFALFPFGSFTSKPDGREWFENILEKNVHNILPRGPTCVSEWTYVFKLSALHVLLNENPQLYKCPNYVTYDYRMRVHPPSSLKDNLHQLKN